jgi:hypothetical protein
MTKYIEKIVNIQTGEETLREYSAAETEAQEKLIAKNLDEIAQMELVSVQVQEKKAALLKKLGITADEANVLLS